MNRDCLLWDLELAGDDPKFTVRIIIRHYRKEKLEKLKERGLSSFEHFCLQTDVHLIPNDFVRMLSILKDIEISSPEERKELILQSIKEKVGKYITQMRSDKTRSR
jgi:hypothetical protein